MASLDPRCILQPIVRLADRHVVGWEALVRFRDGRPPLEHFLEAQAERRLVELELRALRAVVLAAGAVPRGHWLAINLTGTTLGAAAPAIARLLGQLGCPLVIELCEWGTDHDGAQRGIGYLRRRLARPMRIGEQTSARLRVALDDIGLSLDPEQLGAIAPEIVKLDRTLVWEAAQSPAVRIALASLVADMENRGIEVIGEGVEDLLIESVLLRAGTRWGQGYLYMDIESSDVPVAARPALATVEQVAFAS